MKNHNFSLGFTLLELIVVVAILATMAAALLAVLDPFSQIQKSKDARVKSDLSQIQKGLEVYYQDNQSYPTSNLSYQIVDKSGTVRDWGLPWTPYMNILPKDATTANKYIYYSSNGQTYYIYASLNRGSKDSQACTGGQCAAPSGSGINMLNACGGKCNFGVSSPDVSIQ
nr:type II secretion system protein GspG [Candidatus Levybacteria bacterium]